MCHHWECTLIYRPLSYPFRSLILITMNNIPKGRVRNINSQSSINPWKHQDPSGTTRPDQGSQPKIQRYCSGESWDFKMLACLCSMHRIYRGSNEYCSVNFASGQSLEPCYFHSLSLTKLLNHDKSWLDVTD